MPVSVKVKDENSADTLLFSSDTANPFQVEVHDKCWPDAKVVKQEVPKQTSATNNQVTLRLRPRSKPGRVLVWRAKEASGDWSAWQLADCDAARKPVAANQWDDIFLAAVAAAATESA